MMASGYGDPLAVDSANRAKCADHHDDVTAAAGDTGTRLFTTPDDDGPCQLELARLTDARTSQRDTARNGLTRHRRPTARLLPSASQLEFMS